MDALSQILSTSAPPEVLVDPSPRDFDVYLPWACKKLNVDVHLEFIRSEIQKKPIGRKTRGRKSIYADVQNFASKLIKHDDAGSFGDDAKNLLDFKPLIDPKEILKIYTMYDSSGNLVQLKFEKNKKVPWDLLKVIGLIIHYHILISSITISSILTPESFYELNKLITFASITDLCLDDSEHCVGNYDLLLKERNQLKHLSLSRCNIDDATVTRIAINLNYPQPASKSLLVLNLASNLITDEGAKSLAKALRSNRQLVYLNLADNRITDEGGVTIFEALKPFIVTEEEMKSFRARKVQLIKDTERLTVEIMQEIKYAESREFSRKKLQKAIPVNATSKKGKDIVRTALSTINRSITDFKTSCYDKAKAIANETMADINKPFSAENTYFKDDKFYCYGNNCMAYINMSYTNISYITVKTIRAVLFDQQILNRKPRGLVNVSIEGNLIPLRCGELVEIDAILSQNESAQNKAKK